MKKIYQCYEYCPEEPEYLREWTEDEILEEYWGWWSEKMVKKYGYGHELITKENCIEDWLVTNWAWEKKDA